MTDERIVAFAEAQERRRRRGPPSSRSPDLPVIRLSPGGLADEVDAAEAALTAAGKNLYVHGGRLVEPVWIDSKVSGGRSLQLLEVPVPRMLYLLSKSAGFDQFSKTADDWVPASCPHIIAEALISLGTWRFPVMVGCIGTPTLRPDGSLLSKPGYDPATGYLLHTLPPMPVVPESPTRQDALAALALLDGLLDEFPFAYDEAAGETLARNPNRSVALSALISPVLRPGIGLTPLHAITAPTAGTGKSYLLDIASAIACGDRCAVLAVSPKPEETEKRLVGAALGGQPIIALDNVNGTLGGDFLNQVTERPILELRPLGTSRLVRVENTFFIFADGNNFSVVADLVRRTVECEMDANMENPEEREFKRSPVAEVLAERGRYVAAVLTVARAYILAGRPGRPTPLPSFGGWSDTVRGALIWLGHPDPVSTMEKLRVDDPERGGIEAVFAAWPETGWSTTGDLVKTSLDHPDFREALTAVAMAKDGTGVNSDRLGWWLKRRTNRIATVLTNDRTIEKRKLSKYQVKGQKPQWKMEITRGQG